MRTSELPSGTVIRFKTNAKLQLYYELVNEGWSNQDYDFLNVKTNDIMVICRTSIRNQENVGQRVFLNGRERIIHYLRESFIDLNKGVVAGIDITADNFYYDVLES